MRFLANGVVFGSILALAAVGLSLVYGILRLSNFAHGDLLTFGAFAALFVTRAEARLLAPTSIGLGVLLLGTAALDRSWLRRLRPVESHLAWAGGGILLAAPLLLLAAGQPLDRTGNAVLLVGTLVACALTFALVLVLEFSVWRPLRRKGGTVLTLIIVSIGIGLILRNALTLEFGGGIHSFARPTPVSSLLLGVPVSGAQRFTIVVAALLIAGLHAFLRYTRTGKSMRAVADNIDLARTCGIDVDRVVVYVWAIAGALVTVAGVLLSLVNNNTMSVHMGFGLILPLFAAVLLGGIGSPYGAILGGLLVGIGMKLSVLWIGTEYEFASAFAILILVLILRPTGILGARA